MRGLLHLDLTVVADRDPLAAVPHQVGAREALDQAAAPEGVLVRHRNDWLVELLDQALVEVGGRARRATGTEEDVLRTLASAQPAVLLLSEHGPGGSALGLVERARALSPSTACVVHLEADGNLPAAVASGAAAVLSRSVSVADIVGLLTHLAPVVLRDRV